MLLSTRGRLPTIGSSLLAMFVTTAAVAGWAGPTRVRVADRLYPLILDLDANGVQECLIVERETRVSADGRIDVITTLTLVEPLPASAGWGLRREGRRYRHLRHGRIELVGYEPAMDGSATIPDRLPGSVQARYGMLGLVLVPLRSSFGGAERLLRIYNTGRGAYVMTSLEGDFGDLTDPQARSQFAAILAAHGRPAAVAQAALRQPPGPLP